MKVFGVTGWKNTGKTGLMERLVTEITARGHRVSTIKHAHHSTDVDQPGRDSYRHREAGATEVMLASPNRWALMHELRGAPEPPLDALLEKLSPVDLVLIEGFKREPHPKIETYRSTVAKSLLAERDDTIRAIAADCAVQSGGRPVFDLDDTAGIAGFILREVGL
ncbi:molybdopterin-guanine dinucleotide biosynthesis protein B [Tropicimonas marinistellae]|uniref:molybdopterin-guanine dinucleotide biosynthesis protein B n=1 Tax=Tropicimonas marinistellae TaxID=1739787 RepID=UPI00082BB1B9|nr:molybdopterin-guanine dinucleotide biosynthesis protein B [Tropicimonas marinistellae]